MWEFMIGNFFPGPALALMGIYLAVVNYFNSAGFSQLGNELGFSSPGTFPLIIDMVAMLCSATGFFLTLRKNRNK